MPAQINLPSYIKGLTDKEVIASKELHGLNIQYQDFKYRWWRITLDALKDPMLIILFLIAIIYFIFGKYSEGYFMVGAIVLVAGISFYQENRSRIAIAALKALTTPLSRVIRNGVSEQIITTDIVLGDIVIAEEGGFINADGTVVYSHDFSVDESSLTGEAFPVFKSEITTDSNVFSGTMVSSGMAVYKVDKIGSQTKLGQLGKSLATIEDGSSPLQVQIKSFAQKMVLVGVFVFILVCVISFLKTQDFFGSLLKGLTMAMSILPEEIPVAFAVFMALGSRRLINQGILVKKTRVVETLGSATVICTDKTGTITRNSMRLKYIYVHRENKSYEATLPFDPAAFDVLEAAMWASEPQPFDPMEKALHNAYEVLMFRSHNTLVEYVEKYQNEFIHIDDLLSVLRNHLADLDKVFANSATTVANEKEVNRRLVLIRNVVTNTEQQFIKEETTSINHY